MENVEQVSQASSVKATEIPAEETAAQTEDTRPPLEAITEDPQADFTEELILEMDIKDDPEGSELDIVIVKEEMEPEAMFQEHQYIETKMSAARHALIMGFVDTVERYIASPPSAPIASPATPSIENLPLRSQGYTVARTPGGTLRSTEEVAPPMNTPGGHIRRAPLPLSSSLVEKIEAADLTDDEDAMEHVQRWVNDQEYAVPSSHALNTTVEVSRCRSADNASEFSKYTSIVPKGAVSASTADADVRPSCSGMTKTSKQVAKRNEGSDLDSEFDNEFDIEVNAFGDMGREIPDNDELDESARNILSSVERAMDEAADGLLGTSNTFDWEENFESFRGVPETFSGPTPGSVKDYDTPHDAFIDVWDRDFMRHIAQETNRYARQTIGNLKDTKTMRPSSRLQRWTDTDADELMVLFAVYLLMSLVRRTSQKEYWAKLGFTTTPYVKDLMSYDRFILLNKFMHFVDNSELCQNDQRNAETRLQPKLAKLIPVIRHLNQKFSSLYNLEREIAIDESLTLFKGRLSWAQAIRTKAARFGIKSYEICESRTGYLAKFEIYTGKNSDVHGNFVASSTDLGDKTTQVVLGLLQDLERRGHSVTMGNFYNSPSLARYLKTQGFDCLGTLRPYRKHVPNEIAKVSKTAEKGTIIARHSGDVSVLAWKDIKWVTIISTYHDTETYVGSRAGKAQVKPVSVRDYNDTMAGVDGKDQQLSMYLVERKRFVKWYMKMFKRLLNVSIHNAFVMYASSLKRRGKLPMTHREFRYALMDDLAKRYRRVQPSINVPQLEDVRLRRDILHTPKYESGNRNRGKCRVHQRQDIQKPVHTKCVTCDVFLCFEGCWQEYHSLLELKGREVRGRKRKRT